MSLDTQHMLTKQFLNSFDSISKIKGAKILDYGCGDGYASNLFRDYGASVVHSYDLKESLSKIDITDLKHKSYDIIWCHHVIEHQSNPIEFLSTLHYYLNDTGELWLGCPNTSGQRTFSDGHICNFDIGNLTQCLVRSNYCMTSIAWWIVTGQIRIRARRANILSYQLPPVMLKLFMLNKHFNLLELPAKLRW